MVELDKFGTSIIKHNRELCVSGNEAAGLVGTPLYLKEIIKDYFQGREIIGSYPQSFSFSSEVVQKSLLGPILWNITYDSLLRCEIGPNSIMAAYADDIVLISSGNTEETFETEVNTQLPRIGRHMREMKVEVVHHRNW